MYHDYLDTFYDREEKVSDIKEEVNNSKEFVNIFLGHMSNKSDEDKNELFNSIVEHVAKQIVDSD